MFIYALLISSLLHFVICNVPSPRWSHPSLKMDSSMVQNKNHLKEHMDSNVDVDSLSIEEVRFIYFKTHDTNGDNRLDGTEIIQALLHFQDEDGSIGPLEYSFTDDELVSFVDPILKKSDANDDGFLDYAEFMSLQVEKKNE